MSDEEVTVSAARLKLLERNANLAEALWNDPKHGMKIKEIAKEKWPDSNIPELDAIREVKKTESDILTKVEETKKETIARIEAFEAERKKEKEEAREARAKSDFESDVESAKKKYQLTPEGMEKVFARMKEKNNPDVEAAAAWVTDHQPAPLNHTSAPSAFNPFGSRSEDKDWELLNKNPFDGKFAEQEISRITADFANGLGHKYGANGMGGEL